MVVLKLNLTVFQSSGACWKFTKSQWLYVTMVANVKHDKQIHGLVLSFLTDNIMIYDKRVRECALVKDKYM